MQIAKVKYGPQYRVRLRALMTPTNHAKVLPFLMDECWNKIKKLLGLLSLNKQFFSCHFMSKNLTSKWFGHCQQDDDLKHQRNQEPPVLSLARENHCHGGNN